MSGVVPITALVAMVVLSGCTVGGMDILPARLTRPEEAARDAAAEESKRSAEQAKLDQALGRILLMSGDSVRPYEVLGQVTGSGTGTHVRRR